MFYIVPKTADKKLLFYEQLSHFDVINGVLANKFRRKINHAVLSNSCVSKICTGGFKNILLYKVKTLKKK